MWPLKPQNMKLHLCWEKHIASSNSRSNGRSEIFHQGERQGELSLKGMGQRAAWLCHMSGTPNQKGWLERPSLPWVLGIAVSAWEPLIWGSPESSHKCFLILFQSSLILVHVMTKFLRKKNSSLDILLSWLFLPNKGQIQTKIYYSQVSDQLTIM